MQWWMTGRGQRQPEPVGEGRARPRARETNARGQRQDASYQGRPGEMPMASAPPSSRLAARSVTAASGARNRNAAPDRRAWRGAERARWHCPRAG